ncbi:MAG: hypothetical protein ABEK59_13125 [Halobacteria archaeon]
MADGKQSDYVTLSVIIAAAVVISTLFTLALYGSLGFVLGARPGPLEVVTLFFISLYFSYKLTKRTVIATESN